MRRICRVCFSVLCDYTTVRISLVGFLVLTNLAVCTRVAHGQPIARNVVAVATVANTAVVDAACLNAIIIADAQRRAA